MIKLPGSKSIAQRALIFASFKNRETVLKNFPECEDTNVLIEALKKIGVIIKKNNKELRVKGGELHDANAPISFKENATGYRLFLGLLAGRGLKAEIETGKRLSKRPIKPLIEELEKISAGAKKVNFSGKISSQFFSSAYVAFVSKNIKGEICGSTISKPYFDLTKKVHSAINKFTEYRIEGDLSSAAPFFAWSMINKKRIIISDFPFKSKQADIQVLNYFKKLGAKIFKKSADLVFVPPAIIKKTWNEIDGGDFPDGVLSLMIFAPFLNTKTTFKNIAHLKYKESDRLKTMTACLKNCGVQVQGDKNSLTIFPSEIKKTVINPQNDHRIAMNFAVLGLKIKNPDCVNKSFPEFWNELKNINGKIILIGSRGTGKTCVGKKLSELTGRKFIDLDEVMENAENAITKMTDGKIDWSEFRQVESAILKEVLEAEESAIIATGGGAAESKRNRELIKLHGKVIYLYGNPTIIEKRLSQRLKNPTYKNKTAADMKLRHKLYGPIADLSFNSTLMAEADILIEILKNL